jgi:glycosyltransferase involved in cell wall biosynthesis
VKLLVLSPVYPDAPRDGDRVRLWHWLEYLGRRHQVHLSAFGDPMREGRADGLLLHKIEVIHQSAWDRRLAAAWRLFSGMPVSVTSAVSSAMTRAVDQAIEDAEAAGKPFDACFCYRLKMAPYALRFRGPRVLDYTDSLTRYAERRAAVLKLEGRGLAWRWWKRQAEQTAAYEAWAAGQFDAGFFNSHQDCEAVRAMAPAFADELSVAANGVSIPAASHQRPASSSVISFVGHLAYPPNAEAVGWFATQVLPLVQAQRPDAEFHVIGGDAPARLRALEGRPGLRLLGPVKDVAVALRASAVSVCPVRTGAGRQNKLLEAFAAGIPAVATGFSAAGAEAEDGRHLLVADEPAAFAAAVLRLLAQPALGQRLSRQARALVQRLYRWPANAAALEKTLLGAQRRALW